jgi:uncharacterized membrane protein YkvA (DUF1232 family)
MKQAWNKFKKILSKGRSHLTRQETKEVLEILRSPALDSVVDQILEFLEYISAASKGKYKASTEVVVTIVAAILYLLWVMDLIPDFIPVAGYLDDIAVISTAASMCARDLERFSKWKKKRRRISDELLPASGRGVN